jgi:hypothetical protein
MQFRWQKKHRLIKEKVEKPVTMKTEQARRGLTGFLMLMSSSSSMPSFSFHPEPMVHAATQASRFRSQNFPYYA